MSSYISEPILLKFRNNFMLKYLLILRHFLGNQGYKNTLFNLQRSLLHKKNKYQIKCEENAEHGEARNI